MPKEKEKGEKKTYKMKGRGLLLKYFCYTTSSQTNNLRKYTPVEI